MDEPLDGSDVESNYSGISNEDYDEADEDVEKPDEECPSASDEEPASDVEDVLSEGDGSEILSASNAEDAMSDAGDVLPASGNEGVYPESNAKDMSVSDAEDFVLSDEVKSEDESDGAVADRSLASYVKEESMSASNDVRSPLLRLKEESMSASDAEPPASDNFIKDFEDVCVKEESLASDGELVPSTSRGTSGPLFADVHQEGTGGRLERGRRNDTVAGAGTKNKFGVKKTRKSKNAKNVLPTPYAGPRIDDGISLHCYYCEYSCRFKCRLADHVVVHFPPENICGICGKRFHRLGSLNNHLSWIHFGIKPYKCHLCIYAGASKTKLRNHLNRHRKELKAIGADVELTDQFVPVSGNNRTSLSGQMTSSMRTLMENKIKATKKLPPPYTGPRQLGGGPFLCYHCPKSCAKKSFLRKHVKCAHLPPDFFCDVCGFGFAESHVLVNHKKVKHSNDNLFECRLCHFKTKWRRSLKLHLTKVHGNAPNRNAVMKPSLFCFYCGWSARLKNLMAAHMKSHFRRSGLPRHVARAHVTPPRAAHVEKGAKCEFCEFRTKNLNTLMEHVRMHTGEGYPCELCDFECISLTSLKLHERNHSENDFKCPVCPFATFQLITFTHHLKVHTDVGHVDDTSYACQSCPDRFESIAGFQEHMLSHYNDFRCPQCSYVTHNRATLNKHIEAQHTDALRYNCDFCDFKTKRRSSLKIHINALHTKSEWFQCRFCNYKSLIKRNVNCHERIHTCKKLHACDWCDYKCIRLSSMKSHTLIHTGELPFQCDSCDYRARTSTALHRHKLGIHSRARPFKCSFCGKSFKTKQTAKFHELCHTGQVAYHCPECAYKTVANALLKKHLSKMHSELPELPDSYPNGRKKTWQYCKKCAFAVCNKRALERHIKIRHPAERTKL